MLTQVFQLPNVSRGVIRVWQRNFLYFRKTWKVSLFWTVLEPLMYLGAIGYGLGAYVNNMNGTTFVDFYYPGLLCSTAMMVAFFENTYGVYTKLTHQKTYASIIMTRVSAADVVYGEILWGLTKGFLGVLGVALVSVLFGLGHSANLFTALLLLVLSCAMFSSIGLLCCSYARNYDSFIYFTSGFIIPMSLIAGSYFPLEQLPVAIRAIAYLLPLTHSIRAVRNVLEGNYDWLLLLHLAYILVLTWICLAASQRRFQEKLIK